MTKRANLAAALHDAGAKPAQRSAEASAPQPLPEPSTTAVARPPSREGQRAVTTYTNQEAHKQLRMLSVNSGDTVQELMIEAINLLFQQHGMPRIA